MKREFPKRVKSALRQLAATAHERELKVLLKDLGDAFSDWHSGAISSLALADKIDRFAFGQAKRRLRERYETASIVHTNVAQALVRGILKESEVPSDVLEALEKPIEFFRQGIADGTISFDEEEE